MRKTERARLGRRKARLAQNPPKLNVVGRLKDGTAHTSADVIDYENENSLARHEAAHAVAAWIQGLPIAYVQINDDRADTNNRASTLAGVTAVGPPLDEMQAASIGERLVYARQHAFQTLAGVLGSGEAKSANPICICDTNDHSLQAAGKLVHIAGLSDHDARHEAVRLIGVVYAARTTATSERLTGPLSSRV